MCYTRETLYNEITATGEPTYFLQKFGFQPSANFSNNDMSLYLLDSFKSDHVGVTKYVRSKNGSYALVNETVIRFEKYKLQD